MKPSIPKGTRDFSPSEMERRNYIFSTIKEVFSFFGFKQIETPAMENLSTLMGKYGEEGDRLLFKILNSGNFLSGVDSNMLEEKQTAKLANILCEKGLRYDLTVPFARYIVQHRDEITFPFKRFQIQPVWRADRPQKGRYREFYQCDADVIGSHSLINEAELIEIIDKVFGKLNIRTVTKINNRKILAGIAQLIGQTNRITDITVAIDKIDKIGLEKVNAELLSKGISEKSVELLQPILLLKGTNAEKIDKLKQTLKHSEIGLKGIDEIEQIFDYLQGYQTQSTLELDLTLARGLNYYTGAIIEVKPLDFEIGSISGGGRYDNLTGIFGLEGVSGVGISFGADRIYDVMESLNLFPNGSKATTKLLLTYFDQQGQKYALSLLRSLRQKGIATELYPEVSKIKKQMSYANANNILFVGIVGDEEIKNNTITLKNMTSGEQQQVSINNLTNYL